MSTLSLAISALRSPVHVSRSAVVNQDRCVAGEHIVGVGYLRPSRSVAYPFIAAYLADQQAITIRYHQARTGDEKNAALQDLLGHADAHSRLIDEVIKYQADHGNFAKPPAIAAVTSDDKPPAAPTKRRSSRTREPKQ